MLTCLLLVNLGFSVYAHPQCLNFKPPFTPSRPLQFCTEYESFTCCSNNRDEQLRRRYDDIVAQYASTSTGRSYSCRDEMKAVLCQECSPYAAHLFDSESTGVEKPLPAMCPAFCQDFFANCRHATPFLAREGFTPFTPGSADSLCRFLRASDPDYCYPELKTNPVLNQRIVDDAATVDGCLCLELFATRLRNALVFRAPPDGTGRIFIAEQLGVVWIYFKNGTRLPNYFMDISRTVLTTSRTGDERGFLGLAFHPQFESNQRLFVYYSVNTDTGQNVRISEFTTRDSDRNQVDYGSERFLIEISQPYTNHNGGEVRLLLLYLP